MLGAIREVFAAVRFGAVGANVNGGFFIVL